MDKKDKRKWKFKLKKKTWKQKYFDRTKNTNNFLTDKEKEKIRWEQNNNGGKNKEPGYIESAKI